MITKASDGNIHLALAAISRDIVAIGKDRKNEAQGFAFRGIDDIYNALHPICAAHGVTCLPKVVAVTHDKFENKKGNLVYHTHITMGYYFQAADGSTAYAETLGEGMDFGDKSTAKAMSVAHKYLLIEVFLIPVADLIDGDQYDPTVMPREELVARREAQAKAAVEQTITNREVDNAAPAEDEPDNIPGIAGTSESTDSKGWREVVCHVGQANGPMLGKTLGELHPKIIDWLATKWKGGTAPDAKAKALFAAVLQAVADGAAIEKPKAPETTVEPPQKPKEAQPTTPPPQNEPHTPPASKAPANKTEAIDWKTMKIHFPCKVQGKTLADVLAMSPAHLRQVQPLVDKYVGPDPTFEDTAFVAAYTLALKETGVAMDENQARAELKERIDDLALTVDDAETFLKSAGLLPDDATIRTADLNTLRDLLLRWPQIAAEIKKALNPPVAPKAKKGAKK